VELAEDISVVAIEKEEKRILRLKENIKRLGHDINVLCGDASNPTDWFNGELFDRILIDAPCSASGIIRRHPDIKILRRDDDIEVLAEIQKQILTALWPLLKQGGELLYCTCSIFKQENEQQVASFIEEHDDCVELKMVPFHWAQARPVGLQVLPSEHGHDGFYYAKLKKQER
jgi:16S rRNA (cytosine967-C5)-methyltransferase